MRGKFYGIISKQLHVPVAIVADSIKKFKVNTAVNLPGHSRKRNIDPRLQMDSMDFVAASHRDPFKSFVCHLDNDYKTISIQMPHFHSAVILYSTVESGKRQQ
ncbi:hypothetical protein F2P81_022072 [Scophthalmus maximus]|uniref:Uncharacterized protein n=1 Tax=Scophthalmus maximus TaxID=52904 RepID=A0A6A4S1Y5_SCOMX|nr:hypothetical protein F2P81_022072 [Scophthalmus maximus]